MLNLASPAGLVTEIGAISEDQRKIKWEATNSEDRKVS